MEDCICCSLTQPTPDLVDMQTTNIEPSMTVLDAFLLYSDLNPWPAHQAKICKMCMTLLQDVHPFYKKVNGNASSTYGSSSSGRCVCCRRDDGRDLDQIKGLKLDETVCLTDVLLMCFCTDVASNLEDGRICKSCISKCENAFMFREFCKDSHEILARRTINRAAQANAEKIEPAKTPPKSKIRRRKSDPNTEVKEFECGPCGIKTKRKYELLMHMLALHYPNLAATHHRCRFCSKIFKSAEKKNDHEVRLHSDKIKGSQYTDYMFLCNDCGQSFQKLSKLQAHIIKHTQEAESYTCQHCSAVYTSRRTFKRHLRDKHEGGQHRCDQCGRCFTQSVYLERHRAIHETEGPLVCKTCGKRFSAAKQLKLHEYDHLNYRPYNCPELTADGLICGFSSKKKSPFVFHLLGKHGLDYNESRHGVQQDIELAKKIFIEKALVNQKILSHTCQFCGKGFQSAPGLQRHKKSEHLNINFQCKFCDKAYTQKSSLWDHSFKHRDFMPYNCRQCDYKACNKKNFQTHLWNLHNENYTEDIHGYKEETFQQVMDFVMKR